MHQYDSKNATSQIFTIDTGDLYANPKTPRNILLNANDFINVQKSPVNEKRRSIKILGEVFFPGIYFVSATTTLSDVIQRAGGLTEIAFQSGVQVRRDSVLTQEKNAYDFFLEEEQKRLLFLKDAKVEIAKEDARMFIEEQKMRAQGRLILDDKMLNGGNSLVLKDKDVIYIPEKNNTITVVGGVQTARGIPYIKNKGPKYYIKQAGGLNQYASKRHIYVFKANGEINKNAKKVQLGDIIYVPQEARERFSYKKVMESINTNVQMAVNILTSIYLIKSLN